MARWEAEYNQLMSSTRDDWDYGQTTESAYNDMAGNEAVTKFDDEGLPILGDYEFGMCSVFSLSLDLTFGRFIQRKRTGFWILRPRGARYLEMRRQC